MTNPFVALLAESRDLLATIDEPMAQSFVGLLDDASQRAASPSPAPFPFGPLVDHMGTTGSTTAALANALVGAAPFIPWVAPDPAVVAPGWAHGAATAELIGPDGVIAPPNGERFGLLYLGPGLDYPDHRHNAEEFYVVVGGQGDWTIDATTTVLHAGSYSRTPSRATHRIVTHDEAVLTIYGWSGDTSYDSYEF